MKKAVVVIPVGDIAGVGPEIVVKAMGHPEVYEMSLIHIFKRFGGNGPATDASVRY